MDGLARLTFVAAAAIVAAGCAASRPADAPPPAQRAALHFADIGGIRNWRNEGREAILIEGRNGQWYRATFFGVCHELPFATAVYFVTDATGDLDRFSSIIVRGERCYFRSFERIADPDAGG